MERLGKKNNRGHVKVDVNFWRVDKDGNEENLNGDQRDTTNKSIRQYLGSYEDFVLTALSLQNNNTGFIDNYENYDEAIVERPFVNLYDNNGNKLNVILISKPFGFPLSTYPKY